MAQITYSTLTKEAARLLGARIRLGRKERRWTVAQLAERVGITEGTLRKIEQGKLSVSLGAALEAAVLVGVPLFDREPDRRSLESSRVDDRLALLPARTREPRLPKNDF
jgi:transcriptional regulator with XRE-family HTH domain